MTLRNAFENLALDSTLTEVRDAVGTVGDAIASADGVNTTDTTTGPLWAGNTFTGAGERNDYSYVFVNLQADEPGTLYFDFSLDGTNWSTFPVAGYDVAAGINEVHTALKSTRWFRPRFVGGDGSRTYFRLLTAYHKTAVALSSPLTQPVSTDADAQIVRSVNPAITISYFTDETHGTIPSGAAVTIDPVLNTEPNVLDSGWISTTAFSGKNIVGALGDTSLKVFLMNASDDQGSNWFGNGQPTLVTNAGFPAQLSALYPDKFYRIVVCNDSGSPLTDYRISSVAAPESTEGITTAIDQPVFGFFPAQVTRSVNMGRLPAGDYINVPAGGLSTSQSTQDPLAPAGTFIGEYSDARGYASALVFVISDQPLTVNIQWSPDGTNPRPGVISTAAVTEEVIPDGFGPGLDVYVYLDVLTTMVDNYYRLEVENVGVATTTIFESDVWVYTTPYTGSFGGLTDDLSSLSTALLSRSVQAGTTPDGNFVNLRAGGPVAAMTTSTLLPADTAFTSEVVDISGYTQALITVNSDQPGDILFEMFLDEAATERVAAVPFAYLGGSSSRSYGVIVRGRYARLTYTNGPIGQNDLSLITQFGLTPLTGHVGALDEVITPGLIGQTVRAEAFAVDDAGDYSPLTQADDGGLRVSMTGFEAETPIKALSEWSASRFNVGAGSIVRIAANRAGRKSVAIKHNGGAGIVNIGPTAQKVESGESWPLDAKESVVLELDADTEVWASVTGLTGLTSTNERLGGSTANNNGVANPDNLLTIDDQRATFSLLGDSVDVQGFTPEGVYPAIGDVKLRIEGRKSSGSTTETVTFVAAVSATQSNGTAVTSPTVTAMPNGCYVAYVMNGKDGTVNVSNVTGLGLTWTQVATATAAGKVQTSVWVATGSPASNGTVTANFSGTVNQRGTIHVLRFSGVDQTTPVQASDPETGNSTTLSSGTVAGTATTGLFVAGAATDSRDFTMTTPASNRSSLDNNNLRTEVYTGPAAASNTAAGSYDTGGGRDWSLVALTLVPAPSVDPVIEVATDVSGSAGSTLVAPLSQTGDFIVELDITGDRTWDPDDISNLVLTLTATTMGAVDAEVDYVSLEVTEVSEGGAVQVAVLNVGDG